VCFVSLLTYKLLLILLLYFLQIFSNCMRVTKGYTSVNAKIVYVLWR